MSPLASLILLVLWAVAWKDSWLEKSDCRAYEQSFQRKPWVSIWPFWIPRFMCSSCKWTYLALSQLFVSLIFQLQDLMLIYLQELEKLVDVLKHTHELLSKDLSIDSFSLMMNEMLENISLVSYSSRLASQVRKTMVFIYFTDRSS